LYSGIVASLMKILLQRPTKRSAMNVSISRRFFDAFEIARSAADSSMPSASSFLRSPILRKKA
jgi:hypothetical protein